MTRSLLSSSKANKEQELPMMQDMLFVCAWPSSHESKVAAKLFLNAHMSICKICGVWFPTRSGATDALIGSFSCCVAGKCMIDSDLSLPMVCQSIPVSTPHLGSSH